MLFSAKDRAFSRIWRLRGQGLDLQGLQNVSWRTPPLIITLKVLLTDKFYLSIRYLSRATLVTLHLCLYFSSCFVPLELPFIIGQNKLDIDSQCDYFICPVYTSNLRHRFLCLYTEMKSRTQRSRPRPRTDFSRTDPL